MRTILTPSATSLSPSASLSLALLLSLGWSFLAGCAGGNDAKTPASTIATRGGSATATATVARRTASAELQLHWPFDSNARAAVYGDLGGILQTPLLHDGVMPNALKTIGATAPEVAGCINQIASNARELAVGSDARGVLLLLRLDPGSASAAMRACVSAAKSNPMTPLPMAGAEEAWAQGSDVMARKGDLVVAGSSTLATAALNGPQSSWPRDLGLAKDQYLAAVFHEGGASGKSALSALEDRFRLSVDVTLPDAETAQALERNLAPFASPGAGARGRGSAQENEMMTHLQKSIHVDRNDKTLSLAFDLQEDSASQARDVGAMAAMAIDGVRKYIHDSKEVEARTALVVIADDYVAFWGNETPSATKRLRSFPAVPKTIPSGQKYQSSSADWKPWQPIAFSMDLPQYYQYEVKAAKDRKSVDVIARGDLNGDGKISQLTLHLTLDAKTGELTRSDHIDLGQPQE